MTTFRKSVKVAVGLALISLLVAPTTIAHAGTVGVLRCGGGQTTSFKIKVALRVTSDTTKHFRVETQNFSTTRKTFDVDLYTKKELPSRTNVHKHDSSGTQSYLTIPMFKCKTPAGAWRLQPDYESMLRPEKLSEHADIGVVTKGMKQYRYTRLNNGPIGIGLAFHKTSVSTLMTKSFDFETSLVTCLPPAIDWANYVNGIGMLAGVIGLGPEIPYLYSFGLGITGLSSSLLAGNIAPALDVCGVRHPALRSYSDIYTKLRISISSTGKVSVPSVVKFDSCTTNYVYGSNAAVPVACGSKLGISTRGLSPWLGLSGVDSRLHYTITTSVQ